MIGGRTLQAVGGICWGLTLRGRTVVGHHTQRARRWKAQAPLGNRRQPVKRRVPATPRWRALIASPQGMHNRQHDHSELLVLSARWHDRRLRLVPCWDWQLRVSSVRLSPTLNTSGDIPNQPPALRGTLRALGRNSLGDHTEWARGWRWRRGPWRVSHCVAPTPSRRLPREVRVQDRGRVECRRAPAPAINHRGAPSRNRKRIRGPGRAL